ncbi:MAG TPA: hypothetical protein DEG76_02490 [Pseudohongiella sp.]|nr:hypothetical protein [Pseudohongiella sp.]HBX36223.1 hypothetical protein [Pseudohongiella sp.]|tara:strand:- start:14995 stop:15309 length:315 start_codon:yes stop_codon:yes gene_type:complete
MRDVQIQAARDALELHGGLVTFTVGEYSADITAVIRPDVEVMVEYGQVIVTTTLRAISDDLPGLRTGALFLDKATGQHYEFLQTLKNDSITRLISIGKTNAPEV